MSSALLGQFLAEMRVQLLVAPGRMVGRSGHIRRILLLVHHITCSAVIHGLPSGKQLNALRRSERCFIRRFLAVMRIQLLAALTNGG